MLVLVLLRQIFIMAVLMAIGCILSRKKFLSTQGTKDIGAILLRLVIPCVIIRSYLVERTPQKIEAFAISMLLALIGFAVSMAIAYLLYGKRHTIDNFSAAFCNAGFIGIPLIQATVGQEGVFYIAATIAFLNIFQWTYGVYIMTNRKEALNAATVAKNPVVIAVVLGTILFLTQIPVPDIAKQILGYMADTNTPLAMILLGSYLAKVKFKDIFLNKQAYGSVIVRLVLIPLVVLLAYRLIPCPDRNVVLAAFIAAATPVGSNICIFAQQYDCDYNYSVITVCLSTILSVITIPLMFALAQGIIL